MTDRFDDELFPWEDEPGPAAPPPTGEADAERAENSDAQADVSAAARVGDGAGAEGGAVGADHAGEAGGAGETDRAGGADHGVGAGEASDAGEAVGADRADRADHAVGAGDDAGAVEGVSAAGVADRDAPGSDVNPRAAPDDQPGDAGPAASPADVHDRAAGSSAGAAAPRADGGERPEAAGRADAGARPVVRKEYYSISEVSDLVGLPAHVLRYWESQFSVLNPSKNRSGNRVYQRKEIKLILLVKQLLHEEKYTVEGAKQKLDQLRRGGGIQAATVRALDEQLVRVLRDDLLALGELLKVDD